MEQPTRAMITVAEIMTTELVTLGPDDTLAAAAHLMAERGFRHVPIVSTDGSLAGLVSQSDVLAASASTLAGSEAAVDPTRVHVAEFMTTSIGTVDERANLRQAALYLQRHKYGCLPVVTDGRLRGIVTDHDFVGVAIDLLEQLELTEPDDAT